VIRLADVIEALTGIRPTNATQVITDAVIHSQRAIPGALFIAIPGQRVDGHDFIEDAFKRGAALAFVQRDMSVKIPTLDIRQGLNPEAWIQLDAQIPFCLFVEDTVKALQSIARFWRRKNDVRVIGITGSVGKSTTKETIAEVLEQRYLTLKNQGNLNNEIGLPLTLLRLNESYERVVLEMGFYVPGEITLLCDMALPQVGVITNIGTVHAERAGSQETIARGKVELIQALPEGGVAILNYDDPWVRWMAGQTKARVLFYGLSPEADLWADEVESLGLEGIRFCLHYQGDAIYMRIPMIGRHSVHTGLRAAAVGLVEGLSWQEINNGLRATYAQLRLVAVRTQCGALVLDDTYNSTPESALAALNLLSELEGHKVAVLGDMLELGSYEHLGHEKVGLRAGEVADELITVGTRAHTIARAAQKAGLPADNITELENSDQVIEFLRNRLHEQDVVLVKGSRAMHMEEIVDTLEASV
jgi:UDP-N-acetylmuramoyl-tripeptide--D-alanyl-D-alanine ligase